MPNINEENKDLIENRIPWGLLDEETQERMKAWEYGTVFWGCDGGVFHDIAQDNGFYNSEVYRAKPAPERREYFVNLYPHGVMHHDTLTSAAKENLNDTLISVLKIAFDADGSNPTIEVIEADEE